MDMDTGITIAITVIDANAFAPMGRIASQQHLACYPE